MFLLELAPLQLNENQFIVIKNRRGQYRTDGPASEQRSV